ncbi:hypothetical protein QBC46DRAFT_421553 [Diplogelasinospora grovesii]|uniref:Uncharacterized protein n=1 Tax=Diplogelasinospora grovesii TaxID=303347 RepID=A0AAN6S6T1_9PEZI|nr:hypothetical protein QBC46DRAFT_421553 [Diplogelasinospora grovesii]
MPSWFLAPDFTFRRNGPIRLGTVLKDPLLPTLILASKDNGLPADLKLPPEGKIEETDHEHHRDAGAGGRLKLWVDFLQLASGSVGASADVSHNRAFGKVDHEVWSFDSELSSACLEAIVAAPEVRKHINSGFLRRKDVYIITGGSNLECVEVTPQVLREGLEGKAEVLEHGAGGEDVWVSVQSRLPGHSGT